MNLIEALRHASAALTELDPLAEKHNAVLIDDALSAIHTVEFQGKQFALRISDNGKGLELCTIHRNEPEAKILTILDNGRLGLAENIHPDMVPFLKLDSQDRICVEGQSWRLQWTLEGSLYKSGPFDTYEEALAWGRLNDYSALTDIFHGSYEFDIAEDRVYVIGPGQEPVELTETDLWGDNEQQPNTDNRLNLTCAQINLFQTMIEAGYRNLSQAPGFLRDSDADEVIELANDSTVSDEETAKDFVESIRNLWSKHGRYELTLLLPQP